MLLQIFCTQISSWNFSFCATISTNAAWKNPKRKTNEDKNKQNPWNANRVRIQGPSCLLMSKHLPTLQWRHNGRDGFVNHQPHDCLLNRLFRHRSKKISKLRVTGLCEGNSPGPVNSPHKGPVTQKMFSIWLRHHGSRYSHTLRYIITYFSANVYTLIRQCHSKWPMDSVFRGQSILKVNPMMISTH